MVFSTEALSALNPQGNAVADRARGTTRRKASLVPARRHSRNTLPGFTQQRGHPRDVLATIAERVGRSGLLRKASVSKQFSRASVPVHDYEQLGL